MAGHLCLAFPTHHDAECFHVEVHDLARVPGSLAVAGDPPLPARQAQLLGASLRSCTTVADRRARRATVPATTTTRDAEPAPAEPI